ncbi:unnamed protein product [Protopolystoma xenopodis]|uniref:Uncharacterized protein n=1 Tax=Protopolystoma xenopodis TaxID=117903 RepID=A0A3S5FCE9_9PLAT|nr:unnamed protein product [Protopolystoma xenopodis]
MAKLTDDADYDAGETFDNALSLLSDAGNPDNYYGRRLRTRIQNCGLMRNPLVSVPIRVTSCSAGSFHCLPVSMNSPHRCHRIRSPQCVLLHSVSGS